MGHKHDLHQKKKRRERARTVNPAVNTGSGVEAMPDRLEVVLKCGSAGSLQAVTGAVSSVVHDDVEIVVISSGIGEIRKSDIMMAETGSRLIIGYEVKVSSQVEDQLLTAGVEARLYSVIYRMTDDLRHLCRDYYDRGPLEKIIGEARVVALFKSSRKGIILGCQVEKGVLARGNRFRVVNAMGECYSGRIESIHIKDSAVTEAKAGQQAGLKISNFNKAVVGDLVESFTREQYKPRGWHPEPGVRYPG